MILDGVADTGRKGRVVFNPILQVMAVHEKSVDLIKVVLRRHIGESAAVEGS